MMVDMLYCRPGEGLQEIINAPLPLATVMNDKAKMDTEVSLCNIKRLKVVTFIYR